MEIEIEKIFNVILIICVLLMVYFGIQKYKPNTKPNAKPNAKPNTKPNAKPNTKPNAKPNTKPNAKPNAKPNPKPNPKPNENPTNNETKKSESFVNLDKVYYENKESTNPIRFNYGQKRLVDKQFLKEQEVGMTLSTWYPNTWIENIDESGNPVYNSREKLTGIKEDFIEPKVRFTYEFNSPRSVQMDGVADPDDFKDGEGRTLKEVYDNSFVDYKKTIPKKAMISDDNNKLNIHSAGSNLSFILPDSWIYDQEKPENGGKFVGGLMASDPFTSNSIGNTHAVVDY